MGVGAELIGRAAPGWSVGQWFNSKPLALEDLRGRVVLVRWFTSPDCPFCVATAPSLRAFDERFRGQGLVVIGMYHHKSSQRLDPADVRGYVDHYGFRFPVAIDPDWQTLKRWWLDRDRPFTSVSFLIDRGGVIRHIHPGGSYEPGGAAYREMERRIRLLLAE